jgi:O-antigen/teichoic acid export membrane protein
VILTTGLRGILESFQEFAILSVIKALLGVFNFAGPLLLLPYSTKLVPIVALLAAGRIAVCLVHAHFCRRAIPDLFSDWQIRFSAVSPLVRFGGWMTATNLLGASISSIDRLFIGSMISVAAVAYYTTPQEMMSRIGSVSAAIAGVMFPAFATQWAQERGRTALLFGRGLKLTLIVVFPLIFTSIVFAQEALTVWLGQSIAIQSAGSLRWQAIAVFISCFVQIPFALLQALGRPFLTAGILLLELPLFVVLLWVMIQNFGIEGAAIAWILRLVFELAVSTIFSAQILHLGAVAWRRQLLPILLSIFILVGATFPVGPPLKTVIYGAVMLGFFAAAWVGILDREERRLAAAAVHQVLVRGRFVK